jgi:hypothetical protein
MGTQRVQMKGVLLWLMSALVGPVQNVFFLTVQKRYNITIPIAQQAGQEAVLGRMSLSMCLWAFFFRVL